MQSVATLDSARLADCPTLEAWSKEYLGFSVHLKPKTKVGYESLLKTRILPTFGALPLDLIEGLAIRRWVAEMHSEGLSASRINRAIGCSLRCSLRRSIAGCWIAIRASG